jgi:hypothetical protein
MDTNNEGNIEIGRQMDKDIYTILRITILVEQTSANPDQGMIPASFCKKARDVHLNAIHAAVNVTQNQI